MTLINIKSHIHKKFNTSVKVLILNDYLNANKNAFPIILYSNKSKLRYKTEINMLKLDIVHCYYLQTILLKDDTYLGYSYL